MPHRSDRTAILTRDRSSRRGTEGRLILPGGFECFTIERPWRWNRRSVSCIPPGEYPLRLRASTVVREGTGGEFPEGYEIAEVPDRAFIMIHPANSMYDLEGCVGPGASRSQWGHEIQARIPQRVGDVPTVTHSQQTFREFMLAAEDDRIDRIVVRWTGPRRRRSP